MFRTLFMQSTLAASNCPRGIRTTTSPASTPMIVTTTKISIRVKPCCFPFIDQVSFFEEMSDHAASNGCRGAGL